MCNDPTQTTPGPHQAHPTTQLIGSNHTAQSKNHGHFYGHTPCDPHDPDLKIMDIFVGISPLTP
jgi:hypothetical protein